MQIELSVFESSPERLKLIELSQFVLNRKTENIRSELYEYLVSHALYHRRDEGPISRQDIESALKEKYGLSMPANLLSSCLRSLSASNSVIPRGDKYVLSESVVGEVSLHSGEYSKLREKVINEFVSRVEKSFPKLSEYKTAAIRGCFFSVLSMMFQRYGSICGSVIKGEVAEAGELTELPDFQAICDDALKKLDDPLLRKIVEREFRDYISNPTTELIHFLYSIAQSYTIAQIMNVDPSLQALEKEKLSMRRLFLDTNILISLTTMQAAQLVRPIISFSNSLGVKMVYTPKTEREYLRLLRQSTGRLQRAPKSKRSVIKKVRPLMKDPFVSRYWTELEDGKLQSVDGFLIKMEGFKELLSANFGISQEAPTIDIDRGSDEFAEMSRAVSLADFTKPEPVADHDAYHLLLIQHLREEEDTDELGFRSYFLTRDASLTTAESIMYKGSKTFGNVHASVWLNMITPFLSPKIVLGEASEVYVGLISSQFPSLTKSVNPDLLIDLMGLWMEDPDVDTEVLRRIVGKKYVRDHMRDIDRVLEEEPSKVAEAIDPILKGVVSTLREDHRGKMKELKESHTTEMKKLKEELEGAHTKEISELKQRIESLESAPRRTFIRPLFLTGIILIALMIVCGFISFSLQRPFPETIYYLLGAGGTALIASSYLGEKAFERFK